MPLDINELRQRILAGQPYTREELQESLAALRVHRTEVCTASVSKRKAAVPLSDADLDASLAQLGLEL